MSELRDKQVRFLFALSDLIHMCRSHRWEFTPGEGKVYTPRKVESPGGYEWRADRVHMKDSVHYIGLAQDLNLFVNGEWKTTDCPEWQTLGKFWEGLDKDARWGGRFESIDLNHFSFTHGGKQ